MKKFIGSWLLIGLLCLSAVGVSYKTSQKSYMIGFIPMEKQVNSFGGAVNWLKKMFKHPDIGKGEGTTPEEPTNPVSSPTDISNIDQCVSFCNKHPGTVNQRLQELKTYIKEKYDKEITYPEKRSQGHVLTDNNEKNKMTFIMEDKKFQKIVDGFTGNNVYGKVKSKESFFIKEMKLFLQGKFSKAESLAREERGDKYTVQPYTPFVTASLSLQLKDIALLGGFDLMLLGFAFVEIRSTIIGTLGLSFLSILTGVAFPLSLITTALNSFALGVGSQKLRNMIDIKTWGTVSLIGCLGMFICTVIPFLF